MFSGTRDDMAISASRTADLYLHMLQQAPTLLLGNVPLVLDLQRDRES